MGTKDHVLIVEDDVLIRVNLVQAFREAGFEPSVAVSEREAIDSIIIVRPDWVILDMNIRGGTGLNVLEYLEAEQFSFSRIVVVTGFPSRYPQNEVLVHNVTNYLRKPISPQIVVGLVRRLKQNEVIEASVSRPRMLQLPAAGGMGTYNVINGIYRYNDNSVRVVSGSGLSLMKRLSILEDGQWKPLVHTSTNSSVRNQVLLMRKFFNWKKVILTCKSQYVLNPTVQAMNE